MTGNKKKIKIAFTVDDIYPKPGFGLLLDNGPLGHLTNLHNEFGCKFTLFTIPFNGGNEALRLDKNLKWIQKLKDRDYFEIAQHGLVHDNQNPQYEAQELMGVSPEEVRERIQIGKEIFKQCGIEVSGFKAPGWYIEKEHYAILNDLGFDYVADHFIGTTPIEMNNILRVPYTFSIHQIFHDRVKDNVILQSHVGTNPKTMNLWNDYMEENIRHYLTHIESKYDVEYVTISELVSDYK